MLQCNRDSTALNKYIVVFVVIFYKFNEAKTCDHSEITKKMCENVLLLIQLCILLWEFSPSLRKSVRCKSLNVGCWCWWSIVCCL